MAPARLAQAVGQPLPQTEDRDPTHNEVPLAIAQVLEVLTEAEAAPSPVIELPVRRHSPSGWRSRCVATVAYLLTLAGLVAVATMGSDGTTPSGVPSDGTPTAVAAATP